jgi:hypothetical protein
VNLEGQRFERVAVSDPRMDPLPIQTFASAVAWIGPMSRLLRSPRLRDFGVFSLVLNEVPDSAPAWMTVGIAASLKRPRRFCFIYYSAC